LVKSFIGPLASLVPAYTGPAAPIGDLATPSCCSKLLCCLLRLAKSGQLALSEADALRLLSAGAMPLCVLAPTFSQLGANMVRTGTSLAAIADSAQVFLSHSVEAAELLFAASQGRGSAGTVLPPRALAAAAATSLRPAAFASWMLHTAAAAVMAGGLRRTAPTKLQLQ